MKIEEIVFPAFIEAMKPETLNYVQGILNDIQDMDEMGRIKITEFALHEFIRRFDNGELKLDTSS
jgi:hypothetical protein